MRNVLVIGASGFVGRHLADAGHRVRCLVRTPSRAPGLAARHEVAPGDITDEAAVGRALDGMGAAYVSTHTLSPQRAPGGFMDVERRGLANVVKGCLDRGARRLVYVTSLGITPDAPGTRARGRWAAEESVLGGGLDATVVRPGLIVGAGGQGFGPLMAQARRRVALVPGRGGVRRRSIGVHDLADLLVDILGEPRAHGLRLEVGGDDLLTRDAMIDVAARALGRRPPRKLPMPVGIVAAAAPLLSRLAKLPPGAARGLLEALDVDRVGDVSTSRAILPEIPAGFEAALRRALAEAAVAPNPDERGPR